MAGVLPRAEAAVHGCTHQGGAADRHAPPGLQALQGGHRALGPAQEGARSALPQGTACHASSGVARIVNACLTEVDLPISGRPAPDQPGVAGGDVKCSGRFDSFAPLLKMEGLICGAGTLAQGLFLAYPGLEFAGGLSSAGCRLQVASWSR